MEINEKDVRSMVRLLGDTATHSGCHQEKKRFLMNGLCRMIGADAWLWGLACQLKPGESQVYVGMTHEGFDEARFAHFLEAVEHPVMGKVVEPFYRSVATSRKPITMCRDEIDPDGLSKKGNVGGLWKRANIGDLIMIGYPIDKNSMSCLGVYQSLGAGNFNRRHQKMAHILLSEVPWLHLSGWPEDRGTTVPKLCPRQRTVLNLLLDGLGRKQIAYNMEISENTVSGYTKEVYKHFGVHSQAELLHKFQSAQI